jgi:hypothetical protein
LNSSPMVGSVAMGQNLVRSRTPPRRERSRSPFAPTLTSPAANRVPTLGGLAPPAVGHAVGGAFLGIVSDQGESLTLSTAHPVSAAGIPVCALLSQPQAHQESTACSPWARFVG